MSDRSVSITIGTTGSIRHVNGVRLAGDESKDKMYEPKQSKKMIRVLTVIAYMFTVSFAAIMLSVYYVFLWHPRDAERRNYMDMVPHASKGAPTTTQCPPPLDAGRPLAPTIAASVNEFPTTPREEVTTKRPEPVTSQRAENSLERILLPSSQSEISYTQEDEDT